MRSRSWVWVTVVLILAMLVAGIGAAAFVGGSEDFDPDAGSTPTPDMTPGESAVSGVFQLRQVFFQESGQVQGEPPMRPGPTDGGKDAGRELQRVDCQLKPRPMKDSDNVILCDAFGFRYGLGPSELADDPVESAEASQATSDEWVVTAQLTDEATAEFSDLTKRLQQVGPPLNQVAVVINGVVVTAPAVQETITTGLLQISGPLNEQEAAALALSLS
jgi:preprotein translocase subunit SecD